MRQPSLGPFIFFLILSSFVFSTAYAETTEAETRWKEMNLQARDFLTQQKVAEATQVAKDALELARKKLGESHPSVAKSLNNLGIIYFLQGDYPTAGSYYEQALDLINEEFGGNHPFAADTLINASKISFLQGRFAETLAALERALVIREKEYGKSGSEIVPVLELLAQVHERMGLTQEAREMRARAALIAKSS